MSKKYKRFMNTFIIASILSFIVVLALLAAFYPKKAEAKNKDIVKQLHDADFTKYSGFWMIPFKENKRTMYIHKENFEEAVAKYEQLNYVKHRIKSMLRFYATGKKDDSISNIDISVLDVPVKELKDSLKVLNVKLKKQDKIVKQELELFKFFQAKTKATCRILEYIQGYQSCRNDEEEEEELSLQLTSVKEEK